jgi:hypothetical protein
MAVAGGTLPSQAAITRLLRPTSVPLLPVSHVQDWHDFLVRCLEFKLAGTSKFRFNGHDKISALPFYISKCMYYYCS